MSKGTVVVALGGNAILKPKQAGTIEEQMANVNEACHNIANLIEQGYDVVIAHGNGPQVGNILLQNAAARKDVPAMPLEVCGAESQGLIGYMIQQNMRKELRKKGIDKPVATVLTQVIVDANDAAFKNPTKPIGAFYSEAEAKENMEKKGETWKEDSGRGWRKVVASPMPIDVVELATVKTLIAAGTVVITIGGGGIPVILKDGDLVGVEAVIDKDLASALLAKELDADILCIATDVANVAINFGKPDQKNLETITVAEAKAYDADGQFGKGSMGPKVQAVVSFVEHGGTGLITALANLKDAVTANAGTKIIKG
ncbi:MAG: carbamate kinase [Clostridia bacterium]